MHMAIQTGAYILTMPSKNDHQAHLVVLGDCHPSMDVDLTPYIGIHILQLMTVTQACAKWCGFYGGVHISMINSIQSRILASLTFWARLKII